MTKLTDHTTKIQWIYDNLNSLIAGMKPGERMLSEPKLARQLGVSRATLREAMRSFETQGLIRRRQGSGTYVMHPSQIIESGLEVLESIESLAKRMGLDVSVGALNIERFIASEEERKELGLDSETSVVHVSRVILAENRPVAFLIDILPEDVLDVADLKENFSGSVLDFLLKKGTPKLNSSRCEINAVTASTEVARAFGIQRGDVLLRFKAWLYALEGRIVDYSFSYFLPGYFRFHVARRVGY